MNLLKPHQLPKLPSNMTPEEAVYSLIPMSFSDMVDVKSNNDGLVLTLLKAEDHSKEVIIPRYLFNPECRDMVFPKIILQLSTLSESPVDYFNEYSHMILNQNQLTYLALHHRFSMLRDNNIHYSYLVSQDINNISDLGKNCNYSAYNAKKKNDYSCKLLDVWERDSTSLDDGLSYKGILRGNSFVQRPVGELVVDTQFTKDELIRISRDLPLQASSESMASENSTFVIHPHDKVLYRGCGYGVFQATCPKLKEEQLLNLQRLKSEGKLVPANFKTDGKYQYMKTLFDATKANVPARFKSHLVSDSYSVLQPSTAIFKQDVLNGIQMDATKLDALVVFESMDEDSKRFVCGEIEASNKFASKLVYKDEIVKAVFKEVFVKEGDVLKGDDAMHAVFGIDDEDRQVARDGFKKVSIISVEETGIGGGYKIVARCERQIGSGRLISMTGLKAVTKPKPSLGRISIPLPDGNIREMNVDMITGMNAIKAGTNTIVLAKAALMHRLGYSDTDLLDSLDEVEINRIADQFQTATWTDQYGVVKEVLCGIVQIQVSELSYMFNNVKPQSFMAEAGRFLYNGGMKDLFEHIWEHNVAIEDREVIDELQKIKMDTVGRYVLDDDIPVYSAEGLRKLGIYDPSDLKFEKRPLFKHTSKLLDEDYNKGFYLDLRYRTELINPIPTGPDGKPSMSLNEALEVYPSREGPIVRFPSAKLLNYLSGKTPNGDWIYPQLLVSVSNCLQCLLVPNEMGLYNIGFLNNRRGGSNKYRVENYYDQIHRVLHSERNMASMLLKPRVLGVGMKQMADSLVPKGVVVISDPKTYSKLAAEAGYEWCQESAREGNPTIDHFNAMCIRNPVIWESQAQAFSVWSKEHFRAHLLEVHGIELRDYLVTKYCRELLLMNPDDCLFQQSDVDGK